MKKLSENNQIKVVPEAVKVLIGACILGGILFFFDFKMALLKTLDINQTDVKMILGTAAGFCVLWAILHHWFFTPLLKLYEKREKLTVGAEDNLKEKENEISEVLEKYEILTLEARSQALKEKNEILNRAKAEANSEIEKAKLRVQESVGKAKKDISERKIQLQNDAQKEAESLASEMVNKVLGTLAIVALVLLPLLILKNTAFAEEAVHGAEHGHEAGFITLKFYLINFGIYFALMFLLLRKIVPPAWTSRRSALEQSINKSLKKLEAIEKDYSLAKAKLANADSDITIIKKNISEETKREAEEVKVSMQSAIQRIEKQAKDTLSTEQRNLENTMRRIYSEAALKLAEQKLKARLNIDSDKALRDKTLGNMKELIQ
jgi:F-type H+-transporting ATPase subunit b